jgi:hypothetical protein
MLFLFLMRDFCVVTDNISVQSKPSIQRGKCRLCTYKYVQIFFLFMFVCSVHCTALTLTIPFFIPAWQGFYKTIS